MSDVMDEQFRHVVSLVRKGLEQGALRLRFSGPYDLASFEIVNPASFEGTLTETGIGKENVFRLLRFELPTMLAAILNDAQEAYVRRVTGGVPRAREKEPETPEQEEERKRHAEQSRARLALLETELVSPRVRQRFALRKASTNPVLRRCSGEVNKQIYRLQAEGEVGVYATLVLWTATSRTPEAISSLYGIYDEQIEREKFILSCDEEDLNVLIDALTNLRDRLKEQTAQEEKHDTSE